MNFHQVRFTGLEKLKALKNSLKKPAIKVSYNRPHYKTPVISRAPQQLSIGKSKGLDFVSRDKPELHRSFLQGGAKSTEARTDFKKRIPVIKLSQKYLLINLINLIASLYLGIKKV